MESIRQFLQVIKPEDTLHIYLRFDENLDENSELNDLFISKVATLGKVSCARYIRYKKQFGIWGDETRYAELLRKAGIQVRMRFPKIYIK